MTLLSLFSACTTPSVSTPLYSSSSLVDSCKVSFTSAQLLQKSSHFSDAISGFKKTLLFDSTDESVQLALQPIVINAMVQLMNCYQSNSNPDECVDYLRSLQQKSTLVINNYCQRDVASLLAYALSRTEAMDEAERVMEEALRLPLFNATPQILFRDYAYASAVFFSNPLRQDEVIKYSLLALEQAKLYENPSGAQWIYSLLGTIYKRTGRINEAVDLLLQSVEESRSQNDALGEMNAYNSLTTLYLYWQLPVYANTYATLAIDKIGIGYDNNPMVFATTYLLKARVMQALEQQDSAILFLEMAEQNATLLPYNSGQVDVDCLLGELYLANNQVDKGIARLARVASQATPMNRAKAYQLQAEYYLSANQEPLGERMLDSMYHLLHLSASPTYLEGAYRFAFAHFLQKNDLAAINKYGDALLSELLFLEDAGTAKKLAETIIRFQTENKEQQLRMIQIKAENTRLTYRGYVIGLSCLFSLLIGLLLYKKKVDKMERKLTEQQLSTLLDRLQLLQHHTTKIEQQLQESFQQGESRMQLEAVAPSLLKERGEQIFRERFEQLYPYFLFKLRERIPTIGRKEELLAMLIALKQDNHQIEVLMGIAHRSVNMARYRLRQKFTLKKEQRLEEAIEELLV